MTARQIDEHTNNIIIGAGEVYIDLFDAAGARTGELYLGDAVGARLSIATEETTIFSGTGPVAQELERVVRSVTRTFNLTLHDINLENLGLFTVADVTTIPGAAVVAAEGAIVRPGRWYHLGVGSADRPAGQIALDTPADKAAAIAAVSAVSTATPAVTATQAVAANRFATGASEAEQKGQYIVDFEHARIFWLPQIAGAGAHPLYVAKAGIDAGRAVEIGYTPADPEREQVQGALKQQRGAFRYIEDPAAGEGRNFYAPSCVIAPGGDMALLDGRSSEQQITLAVSAIEPGNGFNPLYIDAQPAP